MAKIGESISRIGADKRVSGKLKFAADLKFDGCLHMKLVTSNLGHAKIISIDKTEALQVEGVVAVISSEDLPKPMPMYGPFYRDRPLIANGFVRYYGEAVAAIVAETEVAAEIAASLVRVTYEELPGVYDLETALSASAPVVKSPFQRSQIPESNNVFDQWNFGWGDVESATVDAIFEGTYSFPMTTHFAIEPHVFVAWPENDGVVILSTIQHPFLLRRVVSDVLEIPLSKVRIIASELGGGFGGKGYPKFEPLLAFISLKYGRTIRLKLTLEETFYVGRRNSSQITVKAGFKKAGRLVFVDIVADFLIGAYVDAAARVVAKSAMAGCGIYNPPNARITAKAILSNTVPGTAFRGFGAPQFMWAIDSVMEKAARELRIDPLEIRLMNMPDKGEVFLQGEKPCDGDWKSGLKRAAELIGWGKPKQKNVGKGLGIGMKTPAPATVSVATVRLHSDSSLSVLIGTTEMGQGSRTVMAQLASETLQIPIERINVTNGDTAIVPFDSITASSRSTVFMGNAVTQACESIKKQLLETVSEKFGFSLNQISYEEGYIRTPDKDLSLSEVVFAKFGYVSGEFVGVGTYKEARNLHHPLGGGVSFYEVIFAGAEVEVDRETGVVDVKKLVTVGDIGKAINPLLVETQDEGGAIQGLGHSLMEHLVLDDHGRLMNAGALDYRIPTTMDIPHSLISDLIENQDGSGPSGAKGTGESGIMPIGSAIGLAISDAIGIEMHSLPITPESIWQAINNHG